MRSTSLSEQFAIPPNAESFFGSANMHPHFTANHLLPQDIQVHVRGRHTITHTLRSQATFIIFVESQDAMVPLCLKLWHAFENDIYVTSDIDTCNAYTLNGFTFNRRHAPGVYLGIAPIYHFQDQQSIELGELLTHPQPDQLEKGVLYALVMKRLPQNWRLDHQIHRGNFGTREDMRFLATTIAHMHQNLEHAPSHPGQLSILQEKWNLNKSFFNEAIAQLQHLFPKHDFATPQHMILDTMDTYFRNHSEHFQQRQVFTRRCHGDLKVNNLWLTHTPPHQSQHLLALDCIDFKDEFAHIDPLSDVAMLAMDLGVHLTASWKNAQPFNDTPEQLVDLFLKHYLEHVESSYSNHVWQWYGLEKAIVCTYVNICADGHTQKGMRYLSMALTYANKLQQQFSGTSH